MTKTAIFGLALSTMAQFALAQYNTPIAVTIDTGSHTCTSIGMEKKTYSDPPITAGESRYFINPAIETVSTYGKGECAYSPDHAPDSYVTKSFCVTDADGQRECSPRLVQVIVRAFADCTNNPGNLGSRIGAECKFTAISKRGNPE
jgi:hypothetical protein